MQTNTHIERRPSYAGQYVGRYPWESTRPVRRPDHLARCTCGRTYRREEGPTCPACADDTSETRAGRLGGGDGEEH